VDVEAASSLPFPGPTARTEEGSVGTEAEGLRLARVRGSHKLGGLEQNGLSVAAFWRG
jgi:hypothetical protein